jgi:hypothetical protein
MSSECAWMLRYMYIDCILVIVQNGKNVDIKLTPHTCVMSGVGQNFGLENFRVSELRIRDG